MGTGWTVPGEGMKFWVVSKGDDRDLGSAREGTGAVLAGIPLGPSLTWLNVESHRATGDSSGDLGCNSGCSLAGPRNGKSLHVPSVPHTQEATRTLAAFLSTQLK